MHEPCTKPADYYDSGDIYAYCAEHMPDMDRKLTWDLRVDEAD